MTISMTAADIAAELAKPLSRELLNSAIPARFAYDGLDGGPRVVPVAFLWNGKQIIICTITESAKVKALTKNPRVAITVDTEGFPPKVLLIRGTARLDVVDGVPAEYVEASKKLVPADQLAEWEAGVRSLYAQMTRITIDVDWAKLLDFETTLPKSVEDKIKQAQG